MATNDDRFRRLPSRSKRVRSFRHRLEPSAEGFEIWPHRGLGVDGGRRVFFVLPRFRFAFMYTRIQALVIVELHIVGFRGVGFGPLRCTKHIYQRLRFHSLHKHRSLTAFDLLHRRR